MRTEIAPRSWAMASHIFNSVADMRGWAGRFAAVLRAGDVIALVGPLGSGKTTLVQGIMDSLKYKGSASSPTFALANEYVTPRGPVYHMDMYRLSTAELAQFPLEDYWGNGICLIEWADKVRNRWPGGTLELELSFQGVSGRQLRLKNPSSDWQKRLGI